MATSKISHWYKWSIDKRGDSFLIRRYRKINGKIKWETYPKEKYRDLNEEEIKSLLKRLNTSFEIEKREALKRYEFDHAFINTKVLEEFDELLKTRANNLEHINALMNCLKEYTIDYYVLKSKLPDPKFWKKKEAGFGKYLLSKKISSGYIKRIIQTTNRFIKFLHDKYPDEVRLFELDPLSRNVLNERSLESKNSSRKKYLEESVFQNIIKKIDKRLIPATCLGYYFGLRRSEVLGLKLDDVFEDSLSIQRQLLKTQPIRSYGPLKSREKREVPFWFSTPDETYQLIQSLEIMHPDTLGHMFQEEMKKMGYSFQFHDLRRTFITSSLRQYHYLDVKLAAGHSDLETTNKYIQDDRDLKKKKFVPKIKAVK